jgi:polyisoprenyl-phosphate glycosyltransferase
LTISTTSSKPLTDIFVSLIAPCGNAAAHLKEDLFELYQILKKNYSFFEIILVLDGSTDNTPQLAHSFLNEMEGLRILQLSRHHGLDIAASAGIDSSIGDYVIVLSLETDPASLIPALIKNISENQTLIYGQPEQSNSYIAPRTFFSKIFNWYCRRYLNVDIQRGGSLVRCMNRKMANQFTQNKDKHRSLRLMTAQLGVRAQPHIYQFKKSQRIKKSFWNDVGTAMDILVSTSAHPMRLLSRAALTFGTLSFLYSIYIFAIYFFKTDVAPGWVTLSFQLSMSFFMLFVVLAILSEYLGKIMNDSRRTEAYSVLDEQNSSVLVESNNKVNVYRELNNK